MSRLSIWNENNIKDRISICLKRESSGSYAQETLTFPLSDILLSFYQTARGYHEPTQKDWSAAMLTEQVLRTCDALQNYGSQLIYEDKKIIIKKSEKKDFEVKLIEKLYEDSVTMLFRELFNLAFGQLYNFTVHDQEKHRKF